MITFGILILILSTFVGRPFCQFLCPYGALLSIFAKFSVWKMGITRKECINCTLCHNSCPVDAIRPPYMNKQKEDRSTGVKRLVLYIVVLPFIIAGCSFLLGMNSELTTKVEIVQYKYKKLSYIIGAFFGLVLGLKLINLSVKRTRKTYEIDHANCVACGKCFNYCPQNKRK